MSIRVADHLPSDTAAAAAAALTPVAHEMQGSKILAIAGQVRQMVAEGHDVCNLTVGDFSPAHFRVPAAISEGTARAVAEGHTNYPPADGIPELKQAVVDLYARELGLVYPPGSVCVGSGARPPIYAAWRLFVEPGDKTVSFLPAWNVGYYAHLTQSDHHFVPTSVETNFFPTVDQATEAIRGARLVILNSPLNPTGTVIDKEVLRGIAQAIVDENKGRERPCMLVYDQVYWMLTAEGIEHFNPVALVPEVAPYVVQVDAISKCFAATGLRVGWGVLPPYLQAKMKGLVGHMGSWAPRPVQLATAEFLQDPAAVAAYMTEIRGAIGARLGKLHGAITDMKARGLPVDSIAPQGAIYLSFRVDLVGRRFDSNEEIRRWMLEEAGLAVVPFQAFDLQGDTGWFRMSVGACGLDELDRSMERLDGILSSC